jgi:membrane fusion protein, multidrug efflux system
VIRTNRKFLVAVLVAVLVAIAAGWYVRSGQAPAAPTAGAGANTPASAATDSLANTPTIDFTESDLVTVAAGPLARTIPLTGTLRPTNQTLVKARVAGELREVDVREGMAVKRGQPVASIDPSEFEVRVLERDAQLKAAESQLAQARRNLDNTRALHEREFVSQNALDAARSNWEVAAGNRDAAAAGLTLARKALADTRLTAPMDGIVAERFAQPGERVPVDARILSIMDLSVMEIEAPVPAAEIGAIRVGQPVELAIEGIDRPQVGRIARIAPTTQAGTRSIPVYIALENRDPSIRAGLFAQGRLAVEQRDNVVAIPTSAVRDAGGRTFAYAVVDGRLVDRDLRLGLRDESVRNAAGGIGVVEVREGLAAGDRIVASNLGALRVGSLVRIVPSPAARSN